MCCAAYAKPSKNMTSSERRGAREMCCAVKMSVCVKNKTKQGQYVACTVQNMFSHETYGCTSWSPYIVAVISGFILSSLPFVSQFYWPASSFPSSACLFLPFHFIVTKKFHSYCVHICTNIQSLTEVIKGLNHSSLKTSYLCVKSIINVQTSNT